MGEQASIIPAARTTLWPARFEMLDLWRGAAALAVVVAHFDVGHSFNLGHNAVLIFFVISGYCIAASADSCLHKGLGFRVYMWRRIRRIYPPYFFALLFFLATRLVKYWMGGAWQFPSTWIGWLQNFTLTQWLTLLFHPMSWPGDNPTLTVGAFWSLNYEEQFYLVVGLLLASLAIVRIPLWITASLLFFSGIVWNIHFPSKSFGIFIEYWALFGVGCLVYIRLTRVENPRLQQLITVSLAIMAAVAAYIAWFAGFDWNPDLRVVYREWFVGFLFAVLLILLRPWSGQIAQWRVARPLFQLGTISYSLYLIHQFNKNLSISISSHLLPAQIPPVCHLIVQVAFLVLLASGFWYCCERPFLNKSLFAPPSLESCSTPEPPLSNR